MSTVECAQPKTLVPPLAAGERLDQPTFHERYEAMPPETRAELVGGVVYMPSPMRLDHGDTSQNVSFCLGYYRLKTPGVTGADGVTVMLDLQGEPQPDHLLRIPAELGGQTQVNDQGYLAGPPELVVEDARSSRSYDLNQKKADYERAGVREYVIVELVPDRIHWFVRRRKRFQALRPGRDGIYRSEVFPGFWLDAEALYANDLERLTRVLDQGLATPEHAAFVTKLAAAREGEDNLMSTVERAQAKTLLPPLVAGQQLDQPTFHERYEAMPPETRAELVGGVVYMPSPLSYDHGEDDNDVSGWLFYYKTFTPGVSSPNNATVILGPKGEPQPDCQLRIPRELGGQTYVDEAGYITGAPELVAEIARSSRYYDLNTKKADYERAGVLEYVVVALDPDSVHWFILRGDHFEDLLPGPDGVYRSEVFPGLWLDAEALFIEDRRRLLAVLELGLASPDHAAFAARLMAAAQGQANDAN